MKVSFGIYVEPYECYSFSPTSFHFYQLDSCNEPNCVALPKFWWSISKKLDWEAHLPWVLYDYQECMCVFDFLNAYLVVTNFVDYWCLEWFLNFEHVNQSLSNTCLVGVPFLDLTRTTHHLNVGVQIEMNKQTTARRSPYTHYGIIIPICWTNQRPGPTIWMQVCFQFCAFRSCLLFLSGIEVLLKFWSQRHNSCRDIFPPQGIVSWSSNKLSITYPHRVKG